MGDLFPNSFQVPTVYIDRLMPLLFDLEFRVLMVSLRHHGQPLSLDVFTAAVGAETNAVAAALNLLLKYGVMDAEESGDAFTFGLPFADEQGVQWQVLELRHAQGQDIAVLLPNRASDELDVHEYALLSRYLRACDSRAVTCAERVMDEEDEQTRTARLRLAEKGWIEVQETGEVREVTPTVKAWLGMGE